MEGVVKGQEGRGTMLITRYCCVIVLLAYGIPHGMKG